MLFRLPGIVNCEEIEGFILDYLEDELPKCQRQPFNVHLAMCKSCRTYLADYKTTLTATAALSNEGDIALEDVPEDLIAAILRPRCP
ncbi:zf-HC2 domain-containing protein [uncultured Tateyamaria sp.]|uniref:anti-sigma factor family protein n=1 Tax=uncultured Tateyamaria sp. TaxID=455651 RepID=UPI00261DE4A9|nr:zf-HC2 domain-containing protein [uncultured Tateyamaria sp.]